MASSLVIHIAAGEDKHTEVLSQDRIRIGASEDCDLRLRASSLPADPKANGILLELARTNGHYRIKDFDSSLDLTHNGKPLSLNSKIKDGDEVRCEPVNLALSFFPVTRSSGSHRPASADAGCALYRNGGDGVCRDRAP